MNINATLIVQIVVFAALWWFTATYVWPPIVKALDERSKRIADGLAAADKAKADLAAAEKRVQAEIAAARNSAAEVRASGEKQAASLVEDARADEAVDVISGAARTGKIGDGKIWCADLRRVERVRTGEQGDDAI